jgi:hypothetical protein
MLDIQFWLMSFGFLLLGFAVGDKIYKYLPKSTRKNKLSIFIVPAILGGLVLSIPLLGLFGLGPINGIINPKVIGEYKNQIDSDIAKLNLYLYNLTEQNKSTNNSITKKIIENNIVQVKNIIKNYEHQKNNLDILTNYNFNLFLSCGLCVFAGSLISIILGRRNEKHEE